MNAQALIDTLARDEITVTVDADGGLDVDGPAKAVDRWLQLIRDSKQAIVTHLAAHDREVSAPAVTDSHPCAGCDHLEVIEIAGQPVAGCLVALPDESEWREEWRPIRHDTPCWRNNAGNLYHEETTWRSDT